MDIKEEHLETICIVARSMTQHLYMEPVYDERLKELERDTTIYERTQECFGLPESWLTLIENKTKRKYLSLLLYGSVNID